MIDWSSSDYTQSGNNLFYIPDIIGGVYLSRNDNINEHLCYECNTSSIKKVEISNSEISNPEILNEGFSQPKQSEQNIISDISKMSPDIIPVANTTNQPISVSTPPAPVYNNFSLQLPNTAPISNTIPIKSNFANNILSSDNFIIFFFIVILLFMIFIELRISNIYKKINGKNSNLT